MATSLARSLHRRALVLACAGLTACTLALPYVEARDEDDEISCSNGADDDLDGIVDCHDESCDATTVCHEDNEAACGDGRDNDVDGIVDCYDVDCVETAACHENFEASCSDGADNDVDRFVDCDDPDCGATAACRENSPELCGNGVDDDSDGQVDCLDDGCDGRCPEEDASYCQDGRDNDGDGMTDAADARCWPFRRVEAERCASIDDTDFTEHFDDPIGFAERFYGASGDAGITMTADGLPALLLAAIPGRADVATIGTVGTYRGGFEDLDVSILVNVLVEGTAFRLGLVPAELAPIGAPPGGGIASDVADIILRDRVTATFVGTADATELPWTGAGWQRITLREVDGALEATVAPVAGLGTGVSAVFPPLPLGDLFDDATPSFRVVIETAGAVFVRDLQVSLRGLNPCGTAATLHDVVVPQLPPDARVGVPGGVVSMGEAVSVVRGGDGSLCALVTGCEWAGSTSWPTSTSYRSVDDGLTWSVGEHAFPRTIGERYANRGLSVAWDDEAGVYRALGSGGIPDSAMTLPLVVAESTDCRTWDGMRTLDLRYAPADPFVEGCGLGVARIDRPSYVVRRVGGATRHEIYWARSPNPREDVVLFRSVSPDGLTFGEPMEVTRFTLSDRPGLSLAVSVIGESDLIVTSPLGPSEPRSGIALLVALDDEGTDFVRIGDVLLGPSETPGTFDRYQVVSGAIASTRLGAVLLYGGVGDYNFDPFVQSGGNISTGTANIRFFDLVEAAPEMP
jgi:hypothetical protein